MDKKSLIACIIVILVFIFFIFMSGREQRDLKKKGVLVEAKITRINYGGKVSGGFQCLFYYNGRKIELPSPSSISKGSLDFVGKTFPAKYLPGTHVFKILITPDDFKKFDLHFPDSLKWIFPYTHLQ